MTAAAGAGRAGANDRRPESVLVVVHDENRNVLLLRRRDLGFWQSVTGSMSWRERDPRDAAVRELHEETGIRAAAGALVDWRSSYRFRILPALAPRFAPGVSANEEHLFSLCVDGVCVCIDPAEHVDWQWCDPLAALGRCWSWSNRMGIRRVLEIG